MVVIQGLVNVSHHVHVAVLCVVVSVELEEVFVVEEHGTVTDLLVHHVDVPPARLE